MSLLLDALKRAEQEKLAKQGERPANDAPRAHAPSPAAMPHREPANAPALELQPVASSASGANTASAKPSGAATAQAVFQAKAAPAPTKADSERNKTVIFIGGGVIVFAVLLIGGYFWWQLNAIPQQITTLARRAPAAGTVTTPSKVDTLVPGAIAPATQRSDTTSTTSTTPSASSGAAPATSTGASPSSTPTPGQTSPAPSTATRSEEAAAPPRTSAEAAARMVREAPSAPSLRLAPTPPPRVPTEIAAGYEALRSGDLNGARRSYTTAYGAEPSSIDANLGLATVEARLGNIGAAAAHYRRVLDVDPGNATALAGLASLADMSQPEQLEQQLRADITRYPQSSALHFALGNLYAARGRWEDAQAAFFEALRLEPASADALYNLAVAMDHMGQSRLAADYYGRALAAARGRSATFDPVRVERRISELRP